MKKLIILLFLLLCSAFVFSQALTGPFGYGKQEKRYKAIDFQGLPVKDTICDLIENTSNGTCEGAVVYRSADSSIYVRTATHWRKIAKGGDLSDYYTKTELQTDGGALVYHSNIFGLAGPTLLGRYTNSTGVAEQISVGYGLSLNTSTGEITGLALNGQTGTTQSFSVGTAGTNFAINSSGNTHTFNLPDASATARGVVTTGFQTFAGSKVFGSNITISSIPNMASPAGQYLVSNGGVVNHRTPSQVLSDISAAPASGSANYIQNGTSAQTADFRITGVGAANNGFETYNNGSASAAAHYNLKNAAGTQSAWIQLTEAATPGMSFWVNSLERLRINSFGYLGFGGTDPRFPIHVSLANDGIATQCTQDVNGSSGGNMGMFATGTPNAANRRLGFLNFGSFTTATTARTGAQIMGFSEGAWTEGVTYPSSLRFYTIQSGVTPAERMRIMPDGKVGIGTLDPQSMLDIAFGAITAQTIQSHSGTDFTLWAQGANNMIFSNGSTITEQMRLTSSGALAIGTNDPFGALHVKKAAALMNIQNTNAFSASSGGAIYMLNSGTPSAGGQKIGAIVMAAAPTDANPQPGAMIDAFTDGAGWTVGSSIPTYMRFLTGGTSSGSPVERMRVNGAGNLLIGTTTDAGQKLQVSGTASAQKVLVTSPTAFDITHNNQNVVKDATTNELVVYDGDVSDYVTLSGNVTLTTAGYYLKTNSTAYTVTVPSASANPGRVYTIKNSGGTTNDITLNLTTNTQTIDGSGTNVAITPGVWIKIISNGTAWFKVGG